MYKKQVQRQLQLRIEAQGKYLKKIIEEQQRLSGVLSDGPGPEAEKVDPATPAPTSESPLLDKTAATERADESFSESHHEPSTPDSACHVSSESERPAKKQRQDLVLTHPILESSVTSSSYPQSHSAYNAHITSCDL